MKIETVWDVIVCGAGPAGVGAGIAFNYIDGKSRFTDINGDGYVDYLNEENSSSRYYRFNPLTNSFQSTSWIETTDPWEYNAGSDYISTDDPEAGTSDDFMSAYFLTDPVVQWMPYKSGTIEITGTASLIQNDTEEFERDGIRLNL